MSETKLPPLDVTQEALPCPFCGQPPEIYEDTHDGDIECRTTGCIHISWRHTKDTVTWEQMLAAWNHRALNTELTAALQREEKELQDMKDAKYIYCLKHAVILWRRYVIRVQKTAEISRH